VDSTGITATTTLASVTCTITFLQYDNRRLYLSNGQVLDVSIEFLPGNFYSRAATQACPIR
jgi:hypothetical protein